MSIHIDQVRAAFDTLGLPADAWDGTVAVTLTPHDVRHTVHVRGDGGVMVGPLGGVVTETVTHDVTRGKEAGNEPTRLCDPCRSEDHLNCTWDEEVPPNRCQCVCPIETDDAQTSTEGLDRSDPDPSAGGGGTGAQRPPQGADGGSEATGGNDELRDRVGRALWEWESTRDRDESRPIHEPAGAFQFADAALAALDLPARDERMRAEGRAQADNAILWHTTCVNCASLYDQLMGECERGAAAERNRIARALRALTTDGHHSTLIPRAEALAIVVGQDEEGGR